MYKMRYLESKDICFYITSVSSVSPGIIVQNHLTRVEEEAVTSKILDKHHQSLTLILTGKNLKNGKCRQKLEPVS